MSTAERPTYRVSWVKGHEDGAYVATADSGPGAALQWAAQDPVDALAGLAERARLLLAGVLDEEPVHWLDGEPSVCPVHLRYAPCREDHFTTPDGEAPYTTDPLVAVAAERHQRTGLPVDQVLAGLRRLRQIAARTDEPPMGADVQHDEAWGAWKAITYADGRREVVATWISDTGHSLDAARTYYAEWRTLEQDETAGPLLRGEVWWRWMLAGASPGRVVVDLGIQRATDPHRTLASAQPDPESGESVDDPPTSRD